MADKKRYTFKSTETKLADDDRSLIVTISTNNPDRSKDVVEPSGANIDNYLGNPVVALNHDYHSLPIAKTEQLEIKEDRIMAKVTFPKKGVYPLADTVYELYKDGFMNAWSIGFMPTEMEPNDIGGFDFKQWELLEYSAVLVPDNPEALTLLRSKGFEVSDDLKVKGKSMKKDKADKKKEVEPEKQEEIVLPKYIVDEASRKMVADAIVELKQLTEALEKIVLLEKKEEKEVENEKEISLIKALKLADKVVGQALRDHKRE